MCPVMPYALEAAEAHNLTHTDEEGNTQIDWDKVKWLAELLESAAWERLEEMENDEHDSA